MITENMNISGLLQTPECNKHVIQISIRSIGDTYTLALEVSESESLSIRNAIDAIRKTTDFNPYVLFCQKVPEKTLSWQNLLNRVMDIFPDEFISEEHEKSHEITEKISRKLDKYLHESTALFSFTWYDETDKEMIHDVVRVPYSHKMSSEVQNFEREIITCANGFLALPFETKVHKESTQNKTVGLETLKEQLESIEFARKNRCSLEPLNSLLTHFRMQEELARKPVKPKIRL